jgi:hypothetical protein
VSIEIVVELQRMSDERWKEAVAGSNKQTSREVAEWTCYFLCTFCHSLRGWETVKAVVSHLRSQIVNDEEAVRLGTVAHMGLPLYGRFKSCGNSISHLLCMIAAESASGLKPLLWTVRLLKILDEIGPKSDWLFQNDDPGGSRRSMNSFNDVFYDALLDIQRRMPELIEEEADVLDDFQLARPFRRGVTTRAQLADVPPGVVEWTNRWGTGTEVLVKGPMRIIYSERKLMLNHFLRFSRAL